MASSSSTFSTSAIASQVRKFVKAKNDKIGSIEPFENDLHVVRFTVSKFDPAEAPVNADLRLHGPMTMEIRFPDDYPLSPFMLRVIKPSCESLTGHVTTIGGAVCHPLLSSEQWSPSFEISPVLESIFADMSTSESGPLRLVKSKREYDLSGALADNERFQRTHATEWKRQRVTNENKRSDKLIHELMIDYMDSPTTQDVLERRQDVMSQIVSNLNDSEEAGIFAMFDPVNPEKLIFETEERTFEVSWKSDTGELDMKCTKGGDAFIESAIRRDKKTLALALDAKEPESIANAAIENMCFIIDSAERGILRLDMRIDLADVEIKLCEMVRRVLGNVSLGRLTQVSQVLALVLCRKLDDERCYVCGAPSMTKETCSSQICRFIHLSDHANLKISAENIDALKFVHYLASNHTTKSDGLSRLHVNLQNEEALHDAGLRLRSMTSNGRISSLFVPKRERNIASEDEISRALWALSEEPVARLISCRKNSFDVDWSRHPMDKMFSKIAASRSFPIVRVYHGSPVSSWYNILTHGLRSMSNTQHMAVGAAYGPGIYVAMSVETAISYAQKGKSPIGIVGEFDMIHDPARVTTHGTFCHVVSDPCLLRLRRVIFS